MEKLELFYNFPNSLNPDLNFTMEVDGKSICFLDLKISIINGQLETSVYSKPFNSHLYLHAKSFYKVSSIRGIQKGVALCLQHIWSPDEYQDYLNCRGHDPKTVHDIFEKISKILKMMQEKRRLEITVTTTELFFRQNLMPGDQMSPK